MSIALKCFHETPIVRTHVLIPLPPPTSQPEEFTLTMEVETLDTLSRLWQSTVNPMRLAAIYKVSVVFVTPPTPAVAARESGPTQGYRHCSRPGDISVGDQWAIDRHLPQDHLHVAQQLSHKSRYRKLRFLGRDRSRRTDAHPLRLEPERWQRKPQSDRQATLSDTAGRNWAGSYELDRSGPEPYSSAANAHRRLAAYGSVAGALPRSWRLPARGRQRHELRRPSVLSQQYGTDQYRSSHIRHACTAGRSSARGKHVRWNWLCFRQDGGVARFVSPDRSTTGEWNVSNHRRNQDRLSAA